MTQLPGSRGVEAHLERRIAVALLVVLLVWSLLLVRLFHLQVVEGDRYRVSAERNSVRTHRVTAPRGMLLDRNGEILVDSRPSFGVFVVPNESDDLGAAIQRVADLAAVPAEQLRERVGQPRGAARFQALPLVRDLDRGALARIEARLWALPGVLTQVKPLRAYRYGSSASHLLGWLGEVSKSELASRDYQGYRRGDLVGKDGIERLFDADLRGRDGGENVLVDAHGHELERLDVVEPQPGKNVVLTIDNRVQLAAERALAATGRAGAAVALDPTSGEVLALVSHPGFDPNRFAAGLAPEDWRALVDDPGKPLHDRALQGQYPPGSTYKVVPALAGLEKGVIGPDFRVECRGSYRLGRRRYRCWKRGGHGRIALHRALVESCDVFFYTVGHELGVDTLAYYARALGLGRKTGLAGSAERSGLVPTEAWKERRFGEPWLLGETISLAIGQGFNLWTPIQLANAYGAIANGGTLYRPFAVKRVTDAYGQVLREYEPEVLGRVPISESSLARVRRGLRGVVHDPHGTGWVMRRLPGGIESAGKTGTAQVVALEKNPPRNDDEVPIERRDHAWFVTYAPADEPRIVVAVLVEHGGHGGSAAAPVALEIVKAFLAPPEEAREAALGDGIDVAAAGALAEEGPALALD